MSRPFSTTDAKRIIEEELSPELAKTVVRAASVLHDLGKATSLFQTRITKEVPFLRLRITDAGLGLLSEGESSVQQARLFPHAAAGEALLLMQGSSVTFAEIIGSHHGKPWAEGSLIYDELQAGAEWKDPRSIALWGRKQDKEIWVDTQKEFFTWAMKTIKL